MIGASCSVPSVLSAAVLASVTAAAKISLWKSTEIICMSQGIAESCGMLACRHEFVREERYMTIETSFSHGKQEGFMLEE